MKETTGKISDTKLRILEESARLFADKGYGSTGIDEIAKNVGITKSVIYYHFKNKEEILETLIHGLFDELIRRKKDAAHLYFHETKMQFREVLEPMDIFRTEMNRHIIKIVLMESIKNSENVPLFEFWDLNLSAVKELYADHGRGDLAEEQVLPLLLKIFFTFFFPIVGFLVFEEKWCEHYGLSSQDARDAMLDGLNEHFEKIIRPRIWDV